jgi:SAM-dependent methyltransferase
MFWTEHIAKLYRGTRPLPANEAKELLRMIVKLAESPGCSRIADVGSGVGRVSGSLRGSRGRFTVDCFDESRAMLSEARRLLGDDPRFSLRECDCSARSFLQQRRPYDTVICHWVANTTERWRELLINAARLVKAEGTLVWFDEGGPIYRWIDGDVGGVEDVASAFWQSFYEGLGVLENPRGLRRRRGLALGDAQSDFLSGFGMTVRKLTDHRRTWVIRRSLRDLWNSVVRLKAFSNFDLIQERVYARAVRVSRDFLVRYPVASAKPIELRFSSCPVVAQWRQEESRVGAWPVEVGALW